MSLSLSKFIIDLSIYLCLDPSTPEPLIVEVPCSASQQGKASNFQQNTSFQQNKGVQSAGVAQKTTKIGVNFAGRFFPARSRYMTTTLIRGRIRGRFVNEVAR